MGMASQGVRRLLAGTTSLAARSAARPKHLTPFFLQRRHEGTDAGSETALETRPTVRKFDPEVRKNLTEFGQYVAECLPKYVQKAQLTSGVSSRITTTRSLAPWLTLLGLTFQPDQTDLRWSTTSSPSASIHAFASRHTLTSSPPLSQSTTYLRLQTGMRGRFGTCMASISPTTLTFAASLLIMGLKAILRERISPSLGILSAVMTMSSGELFRSQLSWRRSSESLTWLPLGNSSLHSGK